MRPLVFISQTVLAAVFLLFLAGPASYAQWSVQEIELRPGWNAVFLEVEPELNACEDVFGQTPVTSVWARAKRFSTVQFLTDPTELVPPQADWLAYFPPDSPRGFLSSLYAVHGGRAYLIELAGTETRRLSLLGKAVVSGIDWVPDSFNLVGFHIDPDQPPAFGSYLAPDPALCSQPIYRLGATGRWEAVTDPAGTAMGRGEAYWIYCKGPSSYDGPLAIDRRLHGVLDFRDQIVEHLLPLKNQSAAAKSVTLRVLPSARPPEKSAEGETLSLDGQVALSYQRLLSWEPFDKPLTIPIDPHSTLAVRLAVRRGAMAPPSNETGDYGSVLEIRDGEGSLYRLPVAAQVSGSKAGLWVGAVSVDQVSEAGDAADRATPTPVGSPFTFRLILHVDGQGVVRLLQHVVVMQIEDPQTGASRFVLITDDSLLPQYEGIGIRDGEIVGRRITSPVFAFDAPLPMTGSFATVLSLADPIMMEYMNALNPFVHRYHPDHDNLDERYANTLAEGAESFTFSRDIRLEFTTTDPANMGDPAWGFDLIGGIYRETLSGVHKSDIHVQGTFTLNRVTSVAVLNDGA